MKKLLVPILLLIMFIPLYVNAETRYLYDVLKDEAENGGLAREYTGEHHDSFTEEPSRKIYHWYADDVNEGNQVLEKNNVIFANHCWQMIRTTDTGGVKLIYNGETEDGKCLTTRGNHVGYSDYITTTLDDSFYYGTDYYFNPEENNFTITGSLSTGKIKVGDYTCKKSSTDEKCETLYYVESINDANNYNVLTLSKNSNIANYGVIPFTNGNSLANSGYMYNKTYKPRVKKNSNKISNIVSSRKYNNNYWYADSIGWDSENQKYYLINPYQITEEDYKNMNGRYTLESYSENIKSSYAYYISNPDNSDSSYYDFIILSKGNDIDYYNYTLTYGDSYIENNDGTYTIENPTTFELKDWPAYYRKLKNYACKDAINNTCNEIWYIDVSNSTNFTYLSSDSGMITYADDFIYENGHYKLSGNITTFWDIHKSENINKLQNHHYTCFSKSLECEKLNYVFFHDYFWEDRYRYIELESGASVNDALNEMLYNDDVNKNSSTIKNGLDAWYKKYLTEYSSLIDDTVYCQSKEIKSYNGWQNGGDINKMLYFGRGNLKISNNIKCTNETDQYSMSNPKAKLEYPIALLSAEEANIMNISKIKYAPTNYWLLTPDYYYENSNNTFYYVSNYSGGIATNSGVSKNALRPVIALKSNTIYKSGDGSTENPYIAEMYKNYAINVEINNETEDLTVEIDDISQVPEGETVNFKVTPIKGHKLTSLRIVDEDNNEVEYTTTDNKNYTFTMPAKDVTIIPTYERVKNAVNVEDNKNTKEFVIEVNDSRAVVYEDTVRFKVEPEDGYEVEDIDIIDEENNKIDYKKTNNINEYEFVMPDTDVLIKPKYKLIPTNSSNIINPNTGTGIYIIIIFMLVISSITYITIKKKN